MVAQRHQRRKMTPSWYRLFPKQALLPVIAIPRLFPEELELKGRQNRIETELEQPWKLYTAEED